MYDTASIVFNIGFKPTADATEAMEVAYEELSENIGVPVDILRNHADDIVVG